MMKRVSSASSSAMVPPGRLFATLRTLRRLLLLLQIHHLLELFACSAHQ